MIKLDIKDKIYNELKLTEIIAQALSQKLDKPYEEVLKLTESLIDKKIDTVSKNILNVGQSKDIDIDKQNNHDEFIKGKSVIKG